MKVLAFDFGASSGRAIIGNYENGIISIEEIHRFDNDPVLVDGSFYWDILRLFHEIKQGITKAKNQTDFESIGIDTWGVDYGVLTKNNDLIGNPYNYRDARTVGVPEEMESLITKEELYNLTGNQIVNFNTVFQLYAFKKQKPELLELVDKVLFIPDLFNYFLTGKMAAECSIASTSQLMNPYTKEWEYKIMDKLGLKREWFPEIVPGGTVIGNLKSDICEELDMTEKKVIAVSSHDTASAVAAVPTTEKDFVFISCGTWSLFGTELEKPVISDLSRKYNITNETGYNNTTRFLKNIIGLWLIQETRRQFKREGKNYSYADMEMLAREEEPFRCFIDPDFPEFMGPGNMPQRIKDFCARTGQYVPETDGAVIRCIYESLAMKYKHTFLQLKECCDKDFSVIHMVGGGTKDTFLCQMTANAANVPVIAGPIEGTAAGNIAVQLISNGAISDIWEARKIIAKSFDVVHYEVEDNKSWEDAYENFKKIVLD